MWFFYRDCILYVLTVLYLQPCSWLCSFIMGQGRVSARGRADRCDRRGEKNILTPVSKHPWEGVKRRGIRVTSPPHVGNKLTPSYQDTTDNSETRVSWRWVFDGRTLTFTRRNGVNSPPVASFRCWWEFCQQTCGATWACPGRDGDARTYRAAAGAQSRKMLEMCLCPLLYMEAFLFLFKTEWRVQSITSQRPGWCRPVCETQPLLCCCRLLCITLYCR